MSKKPNILFMMADDHRYDAMSCLGDVVKTPTMDALSASGCHVVGMHIMNGHSPAVCIPTRASMNTGCNPFRASVDVYDRKISAIPQENVLLGEHLQAHGYDAFHTGKWHLTTEALNRSFNDGAAIFLGGMAKHYGTPVYDYDESADYPREAAKRYEDKHSTEVFADEAIAYINRYDDDKPFFLSCCFTSPHDPRTAPEDWHAKYKADDMPLPENYMDEHPFHLDVLGIRDEKLREYPRTEQIAREEIADYYAMIAHQDKEMGRIIQALADKGLKEDTIIVYTGDHGLAVGRHGLLGKQNMYDHSNRPPLIIAGPGIPEGQRIDEWVYNYDVYPTLCELVGIEPPSSVEGESRVALLNGDKDNSRDQIYIVYCEQMAALKKDKWKLVRYYKDSGAERIQLFDMEADPYEINDLSGDESCRGEINELQASMLSWQKILGDRLADQA